MLFWKKAILKRQVLKKTHTIEIEKFVKESEIESIFYNTPYYVEPDKEGQKAYSLLREAMKETKTVGIGEFVMHNRENLAIIKPYENILLLNKLRYLDEIRDLKGLTLPQDNLVKAKELSMAKKLIGQLTDQFVSEDYKDTYINDLKKIIEAKAKGKKLKKPKQIPKEGKVIDIMELLKKSLAEK